LAHSGYGEKRKVDPKLWNTPNKLSIIRIAVSPLLVLLLLDPGKWMNLFCAILFSLVCMTDWLDGYLARKNNEVTTLGKFLDPLADKLLIVTVLIMLISLNRAPAWMVALIVGREIAVTGLRTIARDEGLVLQASPIGKAKTVAQILAIVPLLLHYPFYGVDFHRIGAVVLWFALILTLWSGADYVMKFLRATGVKSGSSS
jgi:CDP-diacylglycerol--glycerol-3-phosphate 3-phosphatidyltransferase